MKSELIDIFAHGDGPDAEAMVAELGRRGVAEVAARYRASHHHLVGLGRQARGGTRRRPDDLKQLVALHRQWHSLIKELRDAEQALGQDSTEANYSWLQDVKARLSDLDRTEALIEGFGTSSGRPVRSL